MRAERSLSRAEVALAWVLARAALELGLTESEIARLEAPYVPHAVVGFS